MAKHLIDTDLYIDLIQSGTTLPFIREIYDKDAPGIYFSSPHADSHWPDAMNQFMAMEMPSNSRKKILWDNCARLYGVQ